MATGDYHMSNTLALMRQARAALAEYHEQGGITLDELAAELNPSPPYTHPPRQYPYPPKPPKGLC